MTENRFHNQLGDEYELFKLASPHFDELQNGVGGIIKDTFKNNLTNEIKILEIGFGAGATSSIILNADSRVKLVAIDNEPIMLEKAVQNLSKIDSDRYELKIEDALEFLKNLKKESFDVVASAFVIHNFLKDYRRDVIQEIYNVLKPEGLFVNADKIEVTDREKHTKNMEWQLSQFDVYEKIGKPELKQEWVEHYLEDSKPERALIENEFQKNIKDAGFKSFEIQKRWFDDALAVTKK